MTEPSATSKPCAAFVYGVQPGAHAEISSLAREIDAILAEAPPEDISPRVAARIKPRLALAGLLAPAHQIPSKDTYRKHILYADPGRRYTILSLVWQPGQQSPVHGHTAWCAVGVWRGTPRVITYDVEPETEALLGESGRFACAPGETCALQPGLGDVHRLGNPGADLAITIHVYGRDLVEDPGAINHHLSP